MICPWKEPISATINGLFESLQSGLETGDIEYAMYSLKDYCNYYFLSGAFLDDVYERYEKYKELSNKIEYVHDDLVMWKQIGLQLQRQYNEETLICFKNLSESETLQSLKEKNYNIPLLGAYFGKCQLYYFKGDYLKAVENANEASIYLSFVVGKIYPTVYSFYLSLALLGFARTLKPEERLPYIEQAEENQNKLETWAHHAPMNHQHKVNLIEAEKCRVLGKKYEAGDWYDRAITNAKENEFVQEEGLANELAAKFYLDWGREKIAQIYMQEAYYCYAKWGATGKTADLEKRYPQLLQPILRQQRINLTPSTLR